MSSLVQSLIRRILIVDTHVDCVTENSSTNALDVVLLVTEEELVQSESMELLHTLR